MQQKIVLIVSIVVGLLAAFLTRTYLAAKDAEVQQLKADFLKRHDTVEALCFKRDVPSGTVLTKEDIGKITVPKTGLRGQAPRETFSSGPILKEGTPRRAASPPTFARRCAPSP